METKCFFRDRICLITMKIVGHKFVAKVLARTRTRTALEVQLWDVSAG